MTSSVADAIKNGFRMMLFASVIAIIGCSGGDGLDKRYAVSGKVTYKGAPVAYGQINFMPDKPEGRGATGQIKDGEYSLTTLEPGDGAFPGSYSVTVDAKKADFSEAEAEAKKKGSTSAFIPQDMVAKANAKAKNAVPDKYGVLSTSPLKAEVKTQSNTINFDLTD